MSGRPVDDFDDCQNSSAALASAQGTGLTAISRSGEGHLHASDGHAAFAHSSGTTFHRAGSHIACSENVRQAGLERAGRAFALFPGGRIRDERSGFDESFFVTLDLEWQPLRAWLGADHGKNRGRSDHAALGRLRILQLGFFEHFPAKHFSNLGVKENLDVFSRLHPSRKIARHVFEKIVTTDDEQYFGGAIGKEHRCLPRGIAGTSEDNGFPATNLTFQRSGSVVNAHTLKLFAPLRIESPIIRARSNQDAFGSQYGGATFDLETGAVFRCAITVLKRQGLRWRREFRTESICL